MATRGTSTLRFLGSEIMVAIWPFLKRFAKNKMISPFGHF